uniref:Uncharacterized protein n=1 Tax=Plectus sambesii TaxID=2011161 RepID=A0A914UYC6_9BILA
MDQSKQKTTEHHNAALVDSMDSLAVTDNLCADLLSSAEKEPIEVHDKGVAEFENNSRTTFSDAGETECSLQM